MHQYFEHYNHPSYIVAPLGKITITVEIYLILKNGKLLWYILHLATFKDFQQKLYGTIMAQGGQR